MPFSASSRPKNVHAASASCFFTALVHRLACSRIHKFSTTLFCLPPHIVLSQDTPLEKLNKSTRLAEVLEKEESGIQDFLENRVRPFSASYDHLIGTAGRIATRLRAHASQPINGLKAPGVPSASAHTHVDNRKALAHEIKTEAENKQIVRAAAAAKARAVPGKRKLVQANAVGVVKTSQTGGGDGADRGEVWLFFVIYCWPRVLDESPCGLACWKVSIR